MKNVFYAVAIWITVACLCNPSFDNYFIAIYMIIMVGAVIVRDAKKCLANK